MTGVAGDTRTTDVLTPVFVGVLRHLNHDASHFLGVQRVSGKAFTGNVAVVTALFG